MERLQSRAEIDQKMFRGLVARKLHKRVLSPAALTFFQKRFASGEGLVSIHSLAVYIHEQINGTFEDIFHQLSKRVDLLEYPNNGSSTQVTLEDARVIVEDIGAHADDLPKFLEDDKHRDKSVDFRTEPGSSVHRLDCRARSSEFHLCAYRRSTGPFTTAGRGNLVLVQKPCQGLCGVLANKHVQTDGSLHEQNPSRSSIQHMVPDGKKRRLGGMWWAMCGQHPTSLVQCDKGRSSFCHEATGKMYWLHWLLSYCPQASSKGMTLQLHNIGLG